MSRDDDLRTGRMLRLLRRRARLTQAALANVAGVPRADVIRVEAGGAGSINLDRLRRMSEALGARGRFSVWWNGAAADRLLDERHAALVERTVRELERRGWATAVEVSFSEFGERGSIDVLGATQRYRAIAVVEVKSDIGSTEEMHRVLDAKERLAPKIARARFGWDPATVARLLVLPDEDRLRRLIAKHERTMSAIYPANSREVRRWLKAPTGGLRGVWFLSEVRDANLIPPG